VTGYVIYVNKVPIAWKSKAQRTVALSSTEAEYSAIADVCKEVLFISQVMDFMKMSFVKPIKVYVDNIGAIFMAKNKVTSNRTKHISVRHHVIRELIDNGLIDVCFVRSDKNDADLFTKNLEHNIFWKHASKLLN
jgi:hypothetical protein